MHSTDFVFVSYSQESLCILLNLTKLTVIILYYIILYVVPENACIRQILCLFLILKKALASY